MKSLLKYIPITIVAAFSSCEEVVDPSELKLDGYTPQVVIEGYVQESQSAEVTVKYSDGYFDTSAQKGIDHATVSITDSEGNTEVLHYIPESGGLYRSVAMVGVANRMYTLSVMVEGETYTAQSLLRPSNTVKNLSYRFKEKTEHVNEAGYFVTVLAGNAEGKTDYYRIKGYKNGALLNKKDDLIVMNDYLFDGNDLNVECGFNYQIGDTAKIEVITMDYAGYQFYTSLVDQLAASNGGNFTSPADNIKSNIQGGATGVFIAVSSSAMELVIK